MMKSGRSVSWITIWKGWLVRWPIKESKKAVPFWCRLSFGVSLALVILL